MKLQRLAGFGPAAAFISAAAVIVFSVVLQLAAEIPPSLIVPAVVVILATMTVFVAALAVTLFDLEWIDHAATSTPRIRLALGAALVAAFMPTVLGLIQFAGLPVPDPIPFTIYFLGIGVSVLVHSIEGRRAGILHGALAWIGIADGALFVALAAFQAAVLFTSALVMGAYYSLPVVYVLYVIWAIWMGVHLVRSKAPTPVKAAAAIN